MSPRRVWEIFPQLSGGRHGARIIMVLRVYADESGKGDSPTFVMAGFVGRAQQWAAFEEEWGVVLGWNPPLEIFHMKEAVFRRDFKRIDALAAPLRKYRFPALAVTFYMPDFNRLIRGRISRRFDNPYFMGLIMFMELGLQWQIDNGLCEPMDFVFEEQLHESDHLQAAWGDVYSEMRPEIRERFGNRPVHLKKIDARPLQAADMIAWSLRRIDDIPESQQNQDAFLEGIFAGISLKQDVWTAEKMASLMLYHRQQNARVGRLTDHEWSHVRKDLDAHIDGFNRYSITKAAAGATISLASVPAKGIGRFLLVDSCPNAHIPHLHRRSGGECLGVPHA